MAHDHLPTPDKEPPHKDEGSLEDLFLSAVSPSRRKALMFFGASAISTSALAACGGGSSTATTISAATAASSSSVSSASSSSSVASSSTTTTGTCTTLPDETEGPFPGDGSNTVSGSVVNVLALSGIVRSDIRTSIGSYSGTAPGVPLTLTLRLTNSNLGCTSLAGYAIYIWHCTRDGYYSLYTLTTENYLRGVQVSDANGQVTFTTIVPGCYSGRMPHIHIEVYASASTATSYANKIKTTQLALDPTFAASFYASASGYSASIANLADISFTTDNVFSSASAAELAALTLTPTGSIANGYTAAIDVAVAV